ncbi:HAD family hydrolase [Janibacter alittae]|uniref:HAD family hydrolase n=1 Tax=Janibacter alittae TaxID=3115209 RepID=A0ABZ2MEN9_9MICO
MTRHAICFDLDGTLVDSLPDIIGSIRDALAEHGLRVPDADDVRPLIGLPLEDLFGVVAETDAVPGLCDTYRRIYPQRYTDNSTPFAEVVQVLTALRERGYLLAVTTTKRSAMARDVVTALGLSDHLDHVQGTDDFPAKPAPDVIEHALRTLGAEGAWMVGDTTHDIGAGQAAGLSTFAVCRPEATHDRATLAAASPDRLEESLLPLLDAT